MKLLYNFFIRFTRFAFLASGIFTKKARLFNQGRENLFVKLKSEFETNIDPVIWFHCASLGEFEQGRPVFEQLKDEFPLHKILITFFSPSGYEVRKNYPHADFVCYLPWDTSRNASMLIEICKPVLAIFVKYEFWYHFSDQLKKRNIPLLSISTIFRPQQLFFQWYGGFYRNILMNFSWFFVQNFKSVELLLSIQIKNVTLAGDTRFDRVNQLAKQSDEVTIAREFKGNEKLIVIGSCWPEDLDVLIPFINNHPHLKFIIAPHEISEATLGRIEKEIKLKTIRYSKVNDRSMQFSVLLIDNVGMLGKLYKYGDYAYIGGAFGKDLHNILEAACYGIPIFFGNKSYQKFQEAVDLLNRGGAFAIEDYPSMKAKYDALEFDDAYSRACAITRSYVQENLGATEKIMQHCRTLLSKT